MSRDSAKVVLEPIGRTQEEVATIWATIDGLRTQAGDYLFPAGGFEDHPVRSDGRTFFDE